MEKLSIPGFRPVVRIDAPPSEVRNMVEQLRTGGVSTNMATDTPSSKRHEHLAALGSLPVLTEGGETITLGRLVEEVRAYAGDELLNELTPDTFYQASPFAELGAIPISDSEVDTAVAIFPTTRVRDVFTVARGVSVEEVPVHALNAPGESVGHYHVDKGWWSAILMTRYWAEVRTSMSGYLAADAAGGPYREARNLCETLGGTDIFDAILVDIFCTYASQAPAVRWRCRSVEVTVCCPFECNFSGDKCATGAGTDTSGPIEAHVDRYLYQTNCGWNQPVVRLNIEWADDWSGVYVIGCPS